MSLSHVSVSPGSELARESLEPAGRSVGTRAKFAEGGGSEVVGVMVGPLATSREGKRHTPQLIRVSARPTDDPNDHAKCLMQWLPTSVQVRF